MNITELDQYNLKDAVKFHARLNPRLWGRDEHLLPAVTQKLLAIAADFQEFLGVPDLDVVDITVSGSNAAYSYTPNSDIDLHLVVRMPDSNAEVYQELFNAKKYQYNDEHDIRIGGADVELYVQPAGQKHHSQGIYSVRDGAWQQVPSRRKARIDDTCVRHKSEDLSVRIEQAIASDDEAVMQRILDKIKRMRQAGLEQQGEFGCDNLVFKVLRQGGYIDRLRKAKTAAHDRALSLQERKKKKKAVRYGFGGYWYPGFAFGSESGEGADGGGESVREGHQGQPYSSEDGVAASTQMFLNETDHDQFIEEFIKYTADRLGIESMPRVELHKDDDWAVANHSFGRYDPESHSLHVNLSGRHIMDVLRTTAHELAHCRQHEIAPLPDTAGDTGSPWENEAHAVAGEIMRDWADQHPEMFDIDSLKESASGYIPKNRREAKMPQYAMALSVDIQPGEVGRQANKLALNTGRNGEPTLLMKSVNLREGRIRDLNDPPGPESPPTMPQGTVRVDVSDMYDWYKLGQHISNMKGLGRHDFGKGPPSTIFSFGDEDLEHQYIDALKQTGLTTTDIDPQDPKQPPGMPRQKTDPTYNVAEGLDEAVGGNYLYHATSAAGLKGILSSGGIRSATGPQAATSAQTKLPTVSVTRDWGYASGSNAQKQMADIGRDVILVLDRNAVESNFKTLGTSQSTHIKGLALNPYLKKDGEARSQNTDAMARANAKAKSKYASPTAKAGGEFEEAVVVPKGMLPIKGTMVGFYVNPKSSLVNDVSVMNDPRRLDMIRPNQFVQAQQHPVVAEGKMAELDMDLEDPEISDREFEKIYGMTRREAGELFSKTNIWDFPQVKDPDRPLHEQDVTEGANPGTKKPVFSGWLAMTYQRENAGKKFPSNVRSKSGRDLNKIIPQDEFDINEIEIDDDSISLELSPLLYDNFRLSSTGGGAGQGFSEHFYQLPNVHGFNMALELGKRLLAGEAAIKRWFEEHNQSLRKIGLPEYRVECWGGITSPVWHNDDTSDVIADLDQLRAIYKGQAQLGDFWNKGTIGESLDQDVAKGDLVESLRREFELLEDEFIGEIRMSPTNLRAEAAKTGALAGMEFEMIVPGIEESDAEPEPDFDQDERCRSISDAVDFFHDGEFNGRRDVERLANSMQEDYYEWLGEKIDEDFSKDSTEYIYQYLINNVSGEEIGDIIAQDLSDADGVTKEQAVTAAERVDEDEIQPYFDDAKVWHSEEYGDSWDESDWLDATDLDTMQSIYNAYEIAWPHWNYDTGSNVDIDDVAKDFGDAVGMPVNASRSYHGARREAGHYVVEPDGSLDPENDGDMGLEFVSPPMPIDELLNDLNKVKKWADQRGCYTNRSTGLHINVSVPEFSRDKLDYVKLALLLGDQYVLDQFGRSSNTYTKSALSIVQDRVRQNPNTAQAMLDRMRGHMDDLATKAIHSGETSKYTSINTKEGYIEFRSPGGDWLDENFDKVENTLLRFTVALKAAMDPEAYREEYLKKLYKLLEPTAAEKQGSDTVRYFVDYVAGKIPAAALRSFVKQAQLQRRIAKEPASGKKYWWRVYKDGRDVRNTAMVEVVASSEQEAINKGAAEFGVFSSEYKAYMDAVALRPYVETPPAGGMRPSNPDGNYVIFANNSRAGDPPAYRFMAADNDDAETVLNQWKQQNPGDWEVHYDANQRLGQPAGEWQFELSQTDIENRLGWPDQTGDANYEVINRNTMQPVFLFVANTDQDAGRKFDQILSAMGMPEDTEDYGFRERARPGSTLDIQRRRADQSAQAAVQSATQSQGNNRLWQIVNSADGEVAYEFYLSRENNQQDANEVGLRWVRNNGDPTTTYSVREQPQQTGTVTPQNQEGSVQWRILVGGEEVHRFWNRANQGEANGVAHTWVLDQIRRGLLNPAEGADVEVVPVTGSQS